MTRRENGTTEDELAQEETSANGDVSNENVPEAEETEEAAVAPVELVIASDNPLTEDTVNKETKPQKAKRAEYRTLAYVGDADSLSYVSYKFRPGQPVRVPSVVAEELLRNPFEKFEVKE